MLNKDTHKNDRALDLLIERLYSCIENAYN